MGIILGEPVLSNGEHRNQFNDFAIGNDWGKLLFALGACALVFSRKGSGSSKKKPGANPNTLWENLGDENKQADMDAFAHNRVKKLMIKLNDKLAHPELSSQKLSYPSIVKIAAKEVTGGDAKSDEAKQLVRAYCELDYVFLAIARAGYGLRNAWKTCPEEPEILSIRDLVFRFNRQLGAWRIHRDDLLCAHDLDADGRRTLTKAAEEIREFGWALIGELINSDNHAFESISEIKTSNAFIKPTHTIKGAMLIPCSMDEPNATFTSPKLIALYNTAWSELRAKVADKTEKLSEKEVDAFKTTYRGMDDDKLGKLFSGITKILRAPDAKTRSHEVKETKHGLGTDFKFVEDVLAAAGVQI